QLAGDETEGECENQAHGNRGDERHFMVHGRASSYGKGRLPGLPARLDGRLAGAAADNGKRGDRGQMPTPAKDMEGARSPRACICAGLASPTGFEPVSPP